jgi:hypothetical protein
MQRRCCPERDGEGKNAGEGGKRRNAARRRAAERGGGSRKGGEKVETVGREGEERARFRLTKGDARYGGWIKQNK